MKPLGHLRPLIPFLLVLSMVLLATPSTAAETKACSGDHDVAARYARILAMFDRGQAASRLWWIGWTAGYAAATAGQGVLALSTSDRGTRIDSIVGAAESAVGVVGMLVAAPRTPMWAAGALRSMDDRTACARLRRLRRAEALLEQSATEEASARSWYSQVIGDIINLAGPVVLWTAYRRYASGWYTLAPGLAIQEAQILTQPTAAIATWNAYETEYHPAKQASWSLVPFPGGAGVAGTF